MRLPDGWMFCEEHGLKHDGDRCPRCLSDVEVLAMDEPDFGELAHRVVVKCDGACSAAAACAVEDMLRLAFEAGVKRGNAVKRA